MLNLKESEYFNSLPETAKADILHSGLIFEDENDLNAYVSIFNFNPPDTGYSIHLSESPLHFIPETHKLDIIP